MPPPHDPQVQVLWRRYAHIGLMEGETETQARRTQTVRKHVKLFPSCSSFFTLLCLPCIPSISIVRICYKLQLFARSEGGLLLRNALISSHIWSKFPSTYFKSATFRKSSFGGPIQFQPGRDGILNTSNPLSPPPPSPHLSPHSPFLHLHPLFPPTMAAPRLFGECNKFIRCARHGRIND